MNKISPSILSADFVNLERDIRALGDAGADYVHIDVMDGLFVPNISIGIPVVAAIRRITDLPLDVHLMIDRPIRYVDDFCKAGSRDCYEAIWLCEQGLSGGRNIAGNLCFCPKETVSRAEFLVMAMELESIPVDAKLTISGFSDAADVPAWMQPYLAGAMQRGLISGEVREEGLMFRPNDPITGQEAAVMLQNLLRLPVSAAAVKTGDSSWAADSVQALNEAGISFECPENALTRAEAARLLWQVDQL